jgi:antitoxin component HigA of HigAB toxin-antitoxin module
MVIERHADKRKPSGSTQAATGKPVVTLDDPATFADKAMRAARDVTLLYRLLHKSGITQREIARRTGQSQSEVSEIVNGRTVRDVTVLERIADGLGIPRAWMRLEGVAGVRTAPTVGRVRPPSPRRK